MPQSSELNLRTVGTALPLVVVSVAYHSQSPLTSLAEDLARQTHPPQSWVVVDNAPELAPLDPTPLRAVLGTVSLQLVLGRQGWGFAAGCNAAFDALEQLGHRGWIWLLNPDVSLPTGNELESLQKLLQGQDPSSLLGTAVRDAAGELEASGGWIDPGFNFRRRWIQEQHAQLKPEPLAVDWLSGCSLILCPSVHQPPARFDSGYPLYYEDMDLCLRLAATGAPVLWLPQLRVIHQRGEGSRTPSARRLELSTRSYLRFLSLHRGFWVDQLRRMRLLLMAFLRIPFQPRRAMAVIRGFNPAR